jgi:hypothetical protein
MDYIFSTIVGDEKVRVVPVRAPRPPPSAIRHSVHVSVQLEPELSYRDVIERMDRYGRPYLAEIHTPDHSSLGNRDAMGEELALKVTPNTNSAQRMYNEIVRKYNRMASKHRPITDPDTKQQPMTDAEPKQPITDPDTEADYVEVVVAVMVVVVLICMTTNASMVRRLRRNSEEYSRMY